MSIDAGRWLRLSPWLDQLLDQPAAQRPAWLDALAAQDAGLAAELRALLAGGSGTPLPPPALAMQPLAGRRIGAYTLVEPLGEGGMGTVWLAARSDGRFEGRAAVKLLHAGVVQRALAARFRREGAILARLSHPHIARLVDAGLTEDGQPYLVLEHVAGQRIDRWCDAGRLDARARIALFAQVLQAVQHAHAQLVVHRDLKPANVMVDERGTVKLLDFGIAKLLDDADAPAEATELTRDGGRVLTPLYAAPEQTRGEAAGTAADVYALGLLLYLLLTGQHPRVDAQGRHAADTTLPPASRVVTDRSRRSEDELQAAAAARNTTPVRLAHALAGDIDNILAKALRNEPADRYATVAALADDLQRHLGGHTVSARPDSWAYSASRFVGRHKAGAALAAAALVAVLTAAGAAEHQRREADDARHAAEQQRDAADRQRAVAEAVTIFVQEHLALIGAPGRPLDLATRIELGRKRADQLFFDVPEVQAALNGVFFTLVGDLGRSEVSDQLREAIVGVAQRITDPISRADTLCLTEPKGTSDTDAVAWLTRALQDLPPGDASGGARWRCLVHRAAHLRSLNRYDEALHDVEAGYAAAPPLHKRLRAISYLRQKAHLLNETGRPHAAERAITEVMSMMREAGRAHTLLTADDQIFQAIYTWRMGRPREAALLAAQAAAIAQPAGADTGLASFITLIHGRLLLDLEQNADARRLWEGAMLRDGRIVVPFRRAWDFAAPLHRLRGDPAGGVVGLERDLEQHGGRIPQRDGINRVALVQELLEQRQAGPALQVLDALDASAALPTFRWESLWLRARALGLAGQREQAEVAARAAVAEAQRRAPPEGRSALHGHAWLELAGALAALGRTDEARAAAERAAAELGDALGPDHSATRAAAALARH